MKPIQGLFWAKERRPLIIFMGVEAGIPLMHEPMDPSTKYTLGCCWNHCTTAALTSSFDLNLLPFHTFLRGPNTWLKLQGGRQVWAVCRMIQHLHVHGAQHVLDSADHMGMGIVMQHEETPHGHAGTLSLDGNIKVPKVPCTANISQQFLLADIPWQQRTELQLIGPTTWTDSALGTPNI
jgi:hypothetical protein